MVGQVQHAYVERHQRQRLIVGMLLFGDATALLAATLLAEYVRFRSLNSNVGIAQLMGDVSYTGISFVVVALWLAVIALSGLYDLERLFWGTGEFRRVIEALGIGVVVFIMVTYALKTPGLSRGWTLLAFTFAAVFISAERLAVRILLRSLRYRGRMLRRTLIVGCNQEALDNVRLLESNLQNGLIPVGYVLPSHDLVPDMDCCSGRLPCLGVARDVNSIVAAQGIDTVIITASSFSQQALAGILGDLRGLSVSIHLSTGLSEVLTSRMLVREFAGVPLITVRSVTFSPAQRRTKRAFDLVVAGAALLIGLPVWLLLVAAIKLDSRGPVLYTQQRVGKDGQLFGMYKFRSMCVDADARLEELRAANEATGPLFKIKDDPRVTRVGKWMRKFSIDEFPQLINVMNGEMSLVGPRPPLPNETSEYTDYHWRRMEVPPGMTGLWQVSGRSALTFDEMVRLDLFYIENWTVAFDTALLFRTVPAVLFADGAY